MHKSVVQKVPENCNAVNIVKTIKNSVKQDKFKTKKKGANEYKISKTQSESIKLRKIKSGSIVQTKLKDAKEVCKLIPVKTGNDTIKPQKLRKQTEYYKQIKVDKTRSEFIKLNKTKSGFTEPTKLKELKEVYKSITAKTGNYTIKPKKLKKRTKYCKDIKVDKTRSDYIKLGKLKSKIHKSATECRAGDTECSFNLLEVLLANGDSCFQQKDSNQDNKLVILYDNYSHRKEEKMNNMAPEEVTEEPKESPSEKPDEHEDAGGEQEHIEPPPADMTPEADGEQEHIEPPPADMTAEAGGEQEHIESPPADMTAEVGGEQEHIEPPPVDMTAEGGEIEHIEPPPADMTAEGGEKEPTELPPDMTKEDDTAAPTKAQEPKEPTRFSNGSNGPQTFSKILEELQTAKVLTAKATDNLQKSVIKLTQKDHLTYEEAIRLQKTQAEIMSKLSDFEQLTRHVARMIKMTEVPSSQLDMSMPVFHYLQPAVSSLEPIKEVSPTAEKQVPPKKQFSEEKLPNIIVCGTGTDDNVPKIIVCRPMMECDTQPFSESKISNEDDGVKPSDHRPSGREEKEPPKKTEINNDILGGLLQRVDGCLSAQQKMFAENMLLEKSRYELQMELLRKDQIVEDLQKAMNTLQNEMHSVIQQNMELQQQALLSCQPQQPPMCRKQLCEKFAAKPNQTGSGGETDEVKEWEAKPTVDGGEKDVHTIQNETFPCKQNEQVTTFWGQVPICKLMLPSKSTQTDGLEFDPIFVSEANPEYRTLQEQYCRMKIDYSNKVTEASSLWNDVISLKQEANNQCLLLKEAETMLQDTIEANKCLEAEKQKLLLYKDNYLDLEQQTNLIRQKLRTIEEEGDDAQQILADHTTQLESYRAKYLCVSQLFEELKQEMEQKEKHYSEKLANDCQKTKEKEEEYSEEIRVLKADLQCMQSKLENKIHLHSITLDNVTELSKQIQGLTMENNQLKVQLYNTSNDEKVNQLLSNLETTQSKLEEMQLENTRLRSLTNRLEAMQSENNRRFEEKSHENRQLMTQLETLREESARQVAKVKDRCDTVKKSMQAQINAMETELIQSRAALCLAKKDKDELRQKMQLQIMNLNDNFNDAQAHIKQLLTHVMHLKLSYTQFLTAGGGTLCSSLLSDEENASLQSLCGS